jgi:tight adherence protein C
MMGLILGSAVYLYLRYLGIWSGWEKFAGTAAAAFVGMVIPSKILGLIASKRQDTLRKGFPDALDLLVVSVEAGLGFNAALDRVSKELVISHPELAIELSTVNDEIRAGIDRPQALRNLYTRTGLEDIQGLTTLIAQSLRFGTSIADSLRVYSEEYRDRRMQKAEEQAAKIGTKLIFPLVLCIFPSFFLVMIGPPILGVLTVLGK